MTEGDPESGGSEGVWSMGSGEVTRLVAPSGMAGPRAFAINDRGHIAGWLHPSRKSPSRPFFWTPESGIQILPPPGAGNTWFYDLNQRDQAVGYFEVSPPGTLGNSRAFLWTPEGGFQPLEPLSAEKTLDTTCVFIANAINESGWVAGASYSDDGKPHPVLWMPPDRRPQDLGCAAGFESGAAGDVNDEGTVLVNFRKDQYSLTPFLWTRERGLMELPLPAGYSSAVGQAIDRQGTVLLKAWRESGRERETKGYLVRGGKVLEIPRPWGTVACEYSGLTDRGWFIGRARLKDRPDTWRGFVAQPVR